MKYVQRDGAGKVIGIYGCSQPDSVDGSGHICKGVITESLPDNHRDVLAFNAEVLATAIRQIAG